MGELLAADTVALQRRRLLRLLTHVPLLRHPIRQLPQLLRRGVGALNASDVAPAARRSVAPLRGGRGERAADNGKNTADLLPTCLESLFGSTPRECAAAQH